MQALVGHIALARGFQRAQNLTIHLILLLAPIVRYRQYADNAGDHERHPMLNWTLTFLIIALIAGVLGFTGIAGAAVGIARILFVIFVVFFLVSIIARRA